MPDSFPRQKARTRNFTLGAPRSFQVAQDGSRVVFLRSPAGDDPLTGLWAFDVADGRERLVVDPAALVDGLAAEQLSLEERARRERMRETGGGIVSYATDENATIAVVSQGGRLFLADLAGGAPRELDVPAPAFDPRPDPTGSHVALVHERALHVCRLADGIVTRIAGEDDAAVSWGMAEFVASEEMNRHRGYWWSPDGAALLVARVDEAAVERLWISDPADPSAPPRSVRYPLAGSTNASVQLYVLAVDGSSRTEVSWNRDLYPYVATAGWDRHGPLISVQSRDQRQLLTLAVDANTGETEQLDEQTDEDWVDLVPGVPRRLPDGRLVTAGRAADALALLVEGSAVTPPELQLGAVSSVDEHGVLFTASTEPTEVQVWRWSATGELSALTGDAGVHTAVSGGGVRVVASSALEREGTTWTLGGHEFESRAERPLLEPSVELTTVGPSGIRAGLLLPRDHEPGQKLPVLMDPYGGPHLQRVVAARRMWLESQWLADQGFAVIVADGRGSPARGCRWARAVRGDLATAALEDQVTALVEAAAVHPELDLSRVGIRGWSFGGYLATLAVLRRPDVFHAAVAGAPVTDWRLYDTHYTERYLGTEPQGADSAAYEGSSLLRDAERLERPLLLIHGLADDNVLAGHTLSFSQRLTESGRLHAVLPLTGITHMTPQEAVAENLLIVQVQFLHQVLGSPVAAGG